MGREGARGAEVEVQVKAVERTWLCYYAPCLPRKVRPAFHARRSPLRL